jgi:serine/threonine protein kinase
MNTKMEDESSILSN